jgi:hypothetical protein
LQQSPRVQVQMLLDLFFQNGHQLVHNTRSSKAKIVISLIVGSYSAKMLDIRNCLVVTVCVISLIKYVIT